MLTPAVFKSYYLQHRVPNPVNFTFTQKQVADGQWITDTLSEQNFRHFSNKLNAAVFGSRFKRYGKKLSMLVVREQDETHRHHLHCVIERPEHLTASEFILLVISCWMGTRYGYHQIHFEPPMNEQRELGWVDYCLKSRTKADYTSCIDWLNSTCFESC
jgi:hypothetical protein